MPHPAFCRVGSLCARGAGRILPTFLLSACILDPGALSDEERIDPVTCNSEPGSVVAAGWYPEETPEELEEAITALLERPRGVESDYLRIELQVPGFGGLYLDRDQNIVAWLRDLSRAEEAAALIRSVFLEPPRGRNRGLRRPDGSLPTIAFRQGDYSMSELIRWQQAMWHGFEGRHRVVLADADEGRNRVRFGIRSLTVVPLVEELAVELEVPVEALCFREMQLPVIGG